MTESIPSFGVAHSVLKRYYEIIKRDQEIFKNIGLTTRFLRDNISKSRGKISFDSELMSMTRVLVNPRVDWMKSIQPYVSNFHTFSKKLGEIKKLVEPTFKLTQIYSAQATAYDLLTKISLPPFTLKEIVKEQVRAIHKNLGEELKKINAGYFVMWDGSWKAIDSENPDKIRQSAVSMRELFTQVIHNFSDEKEIMEQNSLMKKGEITRRHRLTYIFRRSGASAEEIINLDSTISSILKVNDDINKATHEKCDEEKFRYLLSIYEGFIWLIIQD